MEKTRMQEIRQDAGAGGDRSDASGNLSRRAFVKGATGIAACAALAGALPAHLTGCSDQGKSVSGDSDSAAEEEGRWVNHACFFACGGRCVNRSYVVGNTVLYQETDTSHADSPDYPQQRGCARGRSLRHVVFGADRLKYPLKRKSWQPGGGENAQRELRGVDEWERISWDEALDYIADETKRIKETYGSTSILAPGYEYWFRAPGLYTAPALNAFGGCTTTWGQASMGAFPVVASKMKGQWNNGRMDFSDRFPLLKSKLIVLWGFNPAYSRAGNSTYFFRQAKEAGAKIIMVDPWYNPSMQALCDEWIPVRPGTDGALLLAIAHYMIENDLQDQEFLDTYCLGFDSEHMPEGVDAAGNFKDYVLGTYDGLPKTPAWASEICGTPVSAITSLADQMATVKPMALRGGIAPARTFNGGMFAQAFYTVGWMTGNVGYEGAEVSAGGADGQGNFGGAPLVVAGSNGVEWPENPVCTAPRGGGSLGAGKFDPDQYYGIAMSELWDSIVSGEFHDFRRGIQPIDIRMIYKIGNGARMNQNADFNKAVEAFRKVDFVVSCDLQMTSDCLYSDIVLPASSWWEREGAAMGAMHREIQIFSEKVIDSLFECREDLEIEADLVERWGFGRETLMPISTRQMYFNQLAGATVATEDPAVFEPLLTITEEDIESFGNVTGEPQQGRIEMSEFLKTGVYQVPRKQDDPYCHVMYKDYIADPVANPLPTESGKFEIYCSALVEAYENFGFQEVAPIAHYVPAEDGYEATFADWESKTKGAYPFQSVSVHYMRRAHQGYDNVGQLRELFPDQTMINELDAAALEIRQDDTVLISSPNGKVLRRACVTPLVVPGVVVMGEGGWVELDDEGIDRAGNPNMLAGTHRCGEGHTPWNTTAVNVEKWTGDQLDPDYAWPQRIIEMD